MPCMDIELKNEWFRNCESSCELDFRAYFWQRVENDYPLRKPDSEPVNFNLSSEHAAVVKWIRHLTENRLSAARVGSNPHFAHWILSFWTLDFCSDYSLNIVQEVKTAATPIWLQCAHRHYRLNLILYRLVTLRNCSQSWCFFWDDLLFSNCIDELFFSKLRNRDSYA